MNIVMKQCVLFWDLTPCNLVVDEPAATILRVYDEDSVCTRLHRYRITEDTAAPTSNLTVMNFRVK
jgi:hypothetical protein